MTRYHFLLTSKHFPPFPFFSVNAHFSSLKKTGESSNAKKGEIPEPGPAEHRQKTSKLEGAEEKKSVAVKQVWYIFN